MEPQRIKLIEGTFTPQEAREILITMINDKIRFHQVKEASGAEHGVDASHSSQRIRELKNEATRVQDMMMEAEQLGVRVELHATVHITEPVTHVTQ